MKEILFKNGKYVVLLADCTGGDYWSPAIPINHVYRLKEDASLLRFHIEKDMKGSTGNGWNARDYPSKLSLRAAYPQEIEAYERIGGPCKASTIFNYEIY